MFRNRHPDHDDQRRCRRDRPNDDRFRPGDARRRGTEAINRCHAGIPQPSGRDFAFSRLAPETSPRGRQVRRQLESSSKERNVKLIVSDEARTWLGEKGLREMFGRASLGRSSRRHQKTARRRLLFGKLAKGGTVRVKVADSKLTFEYPPSPPTETNEPKMPGKPNRGTAFRKRKGGS